MLQGINWEFSQAALAVTLILGTLFVGIHGLNHEYRAEKGRLSPGGKRIAALMIFLGACSLATNGIGSWLSAAKERKALAEQDARFRRQIDSISKLQVDMTRSIDAQRGLFAKADANLKLGAALERETQRGTNDVLRRVFLEGNRVAAERVEVAVGVLCDLSDVKKFGGPLVITGVGLNVKNPKLPELHMGTDKWFPSDTEMVFHNFFGELGAYENFDAWRGARVSIRLVADIPGRGIGSLEDLGGPVPNYDRPLRERLALDARCVASSELFLNGRAVLNAVGDLKLQPNDTIEVTFENLTISNSKLPKLLRK